MKNFKIIAVVVIFCASLALTWYVGYSYGRRRGEIEMYSYALKTMTSTSKLGLIEQWITDDYVDSVDVDSFHKSVIPKILEELDPHSVYTPKQDMSMINQEMDGKFAGVGVQFSIRKDTINIIDVTPDGPSKQAGILPGDRIISLDQEPFVGDSITNDFAMSHLKGEVGTHVEIGVYRPSIRDTISFDIVRDIIPFNSIDASFQITPQTGFIKISRFAEPTFREYYAAMTELKEAGVTNVVLDFRGNSGGYVHIAIAMLETLLEKDMEILYTEGVNSPKKSYSCTKDGEFKEMNIAALVDQFSASASEIVTGALQDNDMALIIGRRTFGKGLVQEQKMFRDSSTVRLTIARYYTPSGRSIQKPYGENEEEYQMEVFDRFSNEEFFHVDSTLYADSLKYKTLSGRTVYGGGGITPDIFIPLDTTYYSPFFYDMSRKNCMINFAYDYSDKNREVLKECKSILDLNEYLDSIDLFTSFVDYCKEKGVTEFEGMDLSKSVLLCQLKANIASNILGSENFYHLIYSVDDPFKRAVEELEK